MNPPVTFVMSWDEAYELSRALDRSISHMETYLEASAAGPDRDFWNDKIVANKRILERLENTRVETLKSAVALRFPIRGAKA